MNLTKGKCCENFAVHVSPEELKASYHYWLENQRDNRRLDMFSDKHKLPRNDFIIWQDIHLLYPMMEYLFSDHIHPNGYLYTPEIIWHHYRCRFHNTITGMCNIYDIRPKMCITFPEGKPCAYDGCECPGDCRTRPIVEKRLEEQIMDKLEDKKFSERPEE